MASVEMDLDLPASQGFSPFTHSPMSSDAPSLSAKLKFPADQLTTLSEAMDTESDFSGWPAKLEQVSTNPDALRRMASNILVQLTTCLSKTDMKTSFIPPLSVDGATQLFDSFNADEKEAFKIGIIKGVKNKDWGDRAFCPLH
jgi:hypothetical protein